MSRRASLTRIVLGLLFLVVVWVGPQLWNRARATRVIAAPEPTSASDNLAETSLETECRSASDSERASAIRRIYLEILGRDPLDSDCAALRDVASGPAGLEEIEGAVAASREARRMAEVRESFVRTVGRDPKGWDLSSLRRWVESPLTPARIQADLAAQRPRVGVHYFTWYRRSEGSVWGNGQTTIEAGSPKPALGWYNSNDKEVMDAHIAQMEGAGVDFAVVNIIAESPPSWGNAHRFFARLAGRTLKAAVMIDGLYSAAAAVKATWVEKAKTEFTGYANYFSFHDQPLIMLFSAHLNFARRGVVLRNIYWTNDYGPGTNTFNPDRVLYPQDWPFWSPSPQPLVNGVVPVIPGYDDSRLGRATPMTHPRDDGQTYHGQWQRALALRPELIIVYSWNEYFEQTAIEPTDRWSDRYLRWTACYAGFARSGKAGVC